MSRSPLKSLPIVSGQVDGGCGRFSAPRKTQAVLRLLKGEGLEALSREFKVTAVMLSQWREAFLAAGQASLKSRPVDERDETISRLQSKVGEMTMEVELLNELIDRVEAGVHLAARLRKVITRISNLNRSEAGCDPRPMEDRKILPLCGKSGSEQRNRKQSRRYASYA